MIRSAEQILSKYCLNLTQIYIMKNASVQDSKIQCIQPLQMLVLRSFNVHNVIHDFQIHRNTALTDL